MSDQTETCSRNTSYGNIYTIYISSVTCRYCAHESAIKWIQVYSRCGLSLWMESRALREGNAKSIGQWLFEDIICRWESVVNIIIDNSALFKKAIK